MGLVVGMVCEGGAATGTWTGAENSFWTNANNWVDGAIPGRYYDPSGTLVGETGDIAVFGNGLTGRAVKTIDFSGVYSAFQILTEGTNTYVYGTAESQYVPIEPFGTFSAAEENTTPAARMVARMRLGVELMATNWGGEMMRVRNNATNEFVLGNWGYNTVSSARPAKASGGEPTVRLTGSGPIRLEGQHVMGWGGEMLDVEMTGKLTVDAVTHVRRLFVPSVSGTSAPMEIEITANGAIGPYSCYNFLAINRDTIITGEGPFQYGVGARGGQGVVCESSLYAPLTLECPLQTLIVGSAPPDDYPKRLNWNGGNKTWTVNGGSDLQGRVCVTGGGTFYLSSLGTTGTFGSLGDVDFALGSGSTVSYTGAGETSDRAFVVSNATATAAGSAKLEQKGSGALTLTGPITLGSGTSGTLELKGSAAAPATLAGTIDGRLSLVKSGSGTWNLVPQNAYTGTVSVSGGTLGVQTSLHLAKLAVTSGSTTLRVADGCTLELDAISVTSGKTIDVILESESAALQVDSGTAGASIAGVTINGHAAVLDANLRLVRVVGTDAVWASAVSGAWTDSTKWATTQMPDLLHNTYLDTPGGDYTVTLDGAVQETTTITNLYLNNFGTGTATLLVTNGATLNVQGHTTSQAVFKLGEGGKVDVVDSMFCLKDQGNATGYISNNSSLDFAGGDMSFRGSSTFSWRGIVASERTGTEIVNLNTVLTFKRGTVTFADNTEMKLVGESKTAPTVFFLNLVPEAAGITSRMVFKDHAHMTASAWTLTVGGNGGHGIFEFDTDYPNDQTLWNCNQIGKGSGVGEWLMKRGQFKTAGYDYLFVGTPGTDDATSTTLFATGRVEIAAGATLSTFGGNPSASLFLGTAIGHGTGQTKARGEAYEYGELNVAGTFTQQRGMFLVGSGITAEGRVEQTGGRVEIVPDETKESATTRGEVGIGVFGGVGRYVQSDGVFTTGHRVFIGGASTNDLRRFHAKNGAFLQQQHDAQGTLAISGGSFTSAKDIVLGCDGTGWIEFSGTGTVAATTLVVSNTVGQAASGLRFTANAATQCGRIDPATKLVFMPGARVEVDVTVQAAAASPHRVVVWNLDEAPEGVANLDLSLIGASGVHTPNSLDLSADGKVLAWNVSRATVLILR